MIKKTVQDINEYVGTTVNPLNSPDTTYELYSVPSYDTDYPEVLLGSEIGSSKVTVEENDVLVCKINPRINRVWVVKHHTEHQLIASSEWVIIRSPENDAHYLRYYFQSPTFRTYINSGLTGIGGSLTRAQPKQIAKYPVPIPDIEIQHDIADTLDKLQSIIAHRKQQLAKLDELVKARFVEMFGDPVSNPMEWETKPLLEIGNCKNGMNFRYDDSGVEIHCLGVGDFKDLSIITDTTILPMISLNEMPSNEYLLQDDDIVFVRSNGNKALVGRCLAVYPDEVPTTFSGFCIRFRKTYSSVTVPYLLRVLKTDSIRKKMAGRGANIQNLNQQILSTLEIPIPPLALQNQFADFVKQTDKSKFITEIIIATIRRVRLYDQF